MTIKHRGHKPRLLSVDNRELAEAVREATAESHRRSDALDDLARRLLVGDDQLKLIRRSSSELTAVQEKKET